MKTMTSGILISLSVLTAWCLAADPNSVAPDKPGASPDHYYKSMNGAILCGYQGWFTCPGDGADMGWSHWGFRSGGCSVDLWPDMTGYDKADQFATSFAYADGSPATVFSSHSEKTVLLHFSWMRQYGLDGVFLQRFAVETGPNSAARQHRDQVMLNCRKGANQYQRAWAMMYDLSGLRRGGVQRVIADWKYLVDTYKVGRDPDDRGYLYHNGKPVVAVWGIGFNDNRQYTLPECLTLITFLKDDPIYGGNTVMIGIPSYWRTGGSDSSKDPNRLEVFAKADILSPWSVGRYSSNNPANLDNYVQSVWIPDMEWCRQHNKEYLPVVYPGFSWHNLKKTASPLNQIPRLKGAFLWRQYHQAMAKAGVKMIYQAMFDEVDEGTAIFKCANNPPVGSTPFVTYEGLPSDFYLRLVGEATKMLRGEIPLSATLPILP